MPSQIEYVQDKNHLGSGLCVFISTTHNISVLFNIMEVFFAIKKIAGLIQKVVSRHW